MKKLIGSTGILALLIACITCINAQAETMKPDIIDVQSTFKYKGTDRSNVVNMVMSEVTLTSGSGTVATGLGTATSAIFTPALSSTGTTTTTFRTSCSGANVTVYGFSASTGNTSTTNFTGSLLSYGTP